MVNFCRKELLYALVIIIGSMEVGWCITFVSPALPLIKEEFQGITTFESSAFQAIPALTAIAGTYWANFLMVKFSRKACLIVNAFCGAVFWLLLLTMSRKYFWASIVIRGLSGVVIGTYSTIDAVYVSELAPPELIGFFGVVNSMMISFGHCSFNLIGAAHSWRFNVYFGAGFCLLQGILTFLLPHSPVDLKNKADLTIPIANELEEINPTMRKKRSLFQKCYLAPMCIGLTLVVIQQFAGINAMVANMSPLLHAAGLSLDSNIQAGIATSAEFIAGFISAFIMDKFGRKKIWVFSCSGALTCMVIFAVNNKFNWSPIIPVIVLFLYMLFFGLGLAGIPWIIVPEMFDDDVRSIASSICTSLNWLGASIVTFCYPFMVESMTQFGSLLLFASICCFGLIFGIFFVPEDPQKYRQKDESYESDSKKEEQEEDDDDEKHEDKKVIDIVAEETPIEL